MLGPQLELGVQLLTSRAPLPNATDRQLVHLTLPMSSLEVMQKGSGTVDGRTCPWPVH